MTSGQINTAHAKETKVKLKRMDVFRNDRDGSPGSPRPYPDTRVWRRAIGEKLKYKNVELKKNLEACLTAPRYVDSFMSWPMSHYLRLEKNPKNYRSVFERETILRSTRSFCMFLCS